MPQFTNVVIIDKDPLTLGKATSDDVDRFADNLTAHLAERFPGKTFNVRQEFGALGNCPDDSEVHEYVRELFRGDGWLGLLNVTPGQLMGACRDAASLRMPVLVQRELYGALVLLETHYGGHPTFFKDNVRSAESIYRALVAFVAESTEGRQKSS